VAWEAGKMAAAWKVSEPVEADQICSTGSSSERQAVMAVDMGIRCKKD
jgi:hypothetical protein